jgi:hypothetical protein
MSQATSSIRPAIAHKRSDAIRVMIDSATAELAQLRDRQRKLVAESPNVSQAHLREIAAQIQAAQTRLGGLNEQHVVAAELDQDEGYQAAEDAFLGHIAVAKKHMKGRAAIGTKLTAAFAQVGALLQELDDVNESAWRHLHEAARDLPRKQRIDLVHDARRVLTGGHATHALLKALVANGIGFRGISAPVIFDAGGDVIPTQTFEQALVRSTASVEGQLDRWASLVRGDQKEPHPISQGCTP